MTPHGPLVYFGILVAAMLEGEIAYVVAATLAGRGYLNPFGVMAAGTAGAALGDQFFFYVLRGRLRQWLDRFGPIERRRDWLIARVRSHETMMVLMIRFTPGLRIAITAACAYAGVAPLRFSTLNLISSGVWAAGLLILVAWVGPKYLPAIGISGWWSALVPAALIVLTFQIVGRLRRRSLVVEAESAETTERPTL